MFKFYQINNDKDRLLYELKKIGVDNYALSLYEKGEIYCIKVLDLSPGQANILKQEALSLGGDVAVAKGSINCKVEKTDALVLLNKKSLKKFIKKLKVQPFNLKVLADELGEYLNLNDTHILVARDKNIYLDEPQIVGILNTTPDSFSDGGCFTDNDSIERRLEYFLENDVKIVDIGGESTRPGSLPISASEEISRIKYALSKALEKDFIVSIDTYKSAVADFALKEGAHIINDISGFTFDDKMVEVCSRYNAAVCLMHIKGTPKDMQNNPQYTNILEEIKLFLINSAKKAINFGIRKNSIILDPGFGFGKTLKDNYIILKYLEEFKMLGYHLLVGVSRKSMIGNIIDKPPIERDIATKAIEFLAITKGADFIRTHDVKTAKDIVKIGKYYKGISLDA